MTSKKYPVGHPLYKPYNQENTLHSTESTSNNKSFCNMEPSYGNSSIESTDYLKLANGNGQNLCFVNTTIRMLRSIGIFQPFFASNAWINHPYRKALGMGQILAELEIMF